jgi:hypothetical protein
MMPETKFILQLLYFTSCLVLSAETYQPMVLSKESSFAGSKLILYAAAI